MSTATSIEWTDVTWNPVRGCSLVSAGCAKCYAMKQAHRFAFKKADVGSDRPGVIEGPYYGLTRMTSSGPVWTGSIKLVHEALDEPLHWKKPRRVFVNSMSDLFHEDVPDNFAHQVFATIRQTPQHTYQILTKRPERMRKFISEYLRPREAMGWANGFYSHVWLGVSVEDQKTADERIPKLLATPAAVRWVSAEPLLGPVDLHKRELLCKTWRRGATIGTYLDWVVIGGEAGPGARPCDVEWIRSIKEQCQETLTPVFVKQLGAKPEEYVIENIGQDGQGNIEDDGRNKPIKLKDRKGGDTSEWPADLRVREWPR